MLKQILSKLVNNQTSEWEDCLADALIGYRIATSKVTGYSPFFLMYLRLPRVPLSKSRQPCATSMEGRIQSLFESLQHVARLTEESRSYNRERLLRRANANDIRVGDTVVVLQPNKSPLATQWDPVYTVMRINGTTHHLRHQQNWQRENLAQRAIESGRSQHYLG